MDPWLVGGGMPGPCGDDATLDGGKALRELDGGLYIGDPLEWLEWPE